MAQLPTLFLSMALGVSALYGQAPADLPVFDQFHVDPVFKGRPAPPMLQTPDQRMFRTMIRESAAKGPNFAGHYTIAEWGCGAGCVSMAIIDAVDGKIYRSPFKVLAWSLLKYEGRHPSNGDDFQELEFKKDSRLLIARGCPEEKNCGSYFYEWTAEGAAPQFKLIRKVPASALPQ
ncbi:MAG TPA: hypothetical protein VGH38_14895 [Bryobacteraceae bacterium]